MTPAADDPNIVVHTLADLRTSPASVLFEGGRRSDVDVSFFLTTFEPGKGPGLHRHPYAEVFLVEEGEARFAVGGEELRVTGGHVLVVPPETPHRFENVGAGRLRVVSMHPSGHVEQTDLDRSE